MKKRTNPVISASAKGAASLVLACALLSPLTAQGVGSSPKLDPYRGIGGAEKIRLDLLQAVSEAAASKSTLDNVASGKAIFAGRNQGQIELVTSDVTPALRSAVAATGAKVLATSERFRRFTVQTTDPLVIEKLAELDGVQMIRPLSEFRTHGAGSVDGYADTALRSRAGSAKYQVTGAGQTVGILSDSFTVTTSNPQTRTISQVAELSLTLSAGNYTLVLELIGEADVTLEYNSSVFLGEATDVYAPAADGSPSDCQNRIPIFGNSGQRTNATRGLANFAASSCAPTEATQYVLYSFSVPAGSPATVSFRAYPDENVPIYLSLRSRCDSLNTEVACVKPRATSEVINLDNQLTRDLPTTVFLIQDAPAGSDEGSAMGELVHDLAPDAAIAFHTAFLGEASFAEGILKLAGILPIGVDAEGEEVFVKSTVIVDDVIYFAEPVYQQGIVAYAAALAVQEGVPFFSAAGNSANNALRQVYVDSDSRNDEEVSPPTGRDLHRWSNGSTFLPITLPPGGSFRALLHWNQPNESVALGALVSSATSLNACRVDLDAYITLTPDEEGLNEVFSAIAAAEGRFSRTVQGNTEFPEGDAFESVFYRNPRNENVTVYLAVDHFWGSQGSIPQINNTPLEFSVIFIDRTDGVQITNIESPAADKGGPTIWGHSVAPGVVAVGAVNYFDTPSFSTAFGPTAEIDPETFSSKGGPLTIFFGYNGLPAPATYFKPDIACVNGNNTTFFPGSTEEPRQNPEVGYGDFDLDGHPNFFGTSAAAPNAAAIAALMLDLNGRLLPDQVTTALRQSAIDVKGARATVGVDDVSGSGLVDALAALDYVSANYGTDTGAVAPTRLIFGFNGSSEGWTAPNPTGITDAGFTAATNSVSANSLDLTLPNNSNSFGWWESPQILASINQQTAFPTINGTAGPGSLYRVEARVSSSVADRANTPTFRIRTAAFGFEQSDILEVNSNGDAALSPQVGAARTYRHYFTMPSTQNRFQVFFDVLGFDSSDAAPATIGLEEIVLQATNEAVLLDSRREKLYLFQGSANGWTPRAVPTLGAVASSSGLQGLTLGPAASASAVGFSYWGSPESAPAATLEGGRLYRITYRVKSDVPANKRDQLPAFRLRANESQFRTAAILNVESSNNSSNVPSSGAIVDYRLFFEAPAGITGSNLLLSFDYLFVPASGNDPTQAITLEAIAVDSFQPPL